MGGSERRAAFTRAVSVRSSVQTSALPNRESPHDYLLDTGSVERDDPPDPMPSELGVGVTTCIAVQAITGEIVCATDRKASLHYTSADGAVSKLKSLGPTWEVMIAGDDV